jgi:hypothetical protein
VIGFFPREEIQREDVTYSIIKALNVGNTFYEQDILDVFTDKEDIHSEFKKYIAIAVKKNIIKGYPIENSDMKYFAPLNTITRAEIAVIIYNSYQGSLPSNKSDEKVTSYNYELNGNATWVKNAYFKIAIPETWNLTEDITMPEDDLLLSKSYTSGESCYLTITVRNFYFPQMTISDYIKIFNITSNRTNILSANEIMFKNYPAAEFLLDLSLSKQKMLVIVGPEHLYEIYYVSSTDSFNENLPKINEVIKSTEFISIENLVSRFQAYIHE